MNRTSSQSQSFVLKYNFGVTPSLSDLKCRQCKSLVDTHQPNPNQPERILGTCSNCGTWYLIETVGDEGQILVLQLPSLAEIPHPVVAVPHS